MRERKLIVCLFPLLIIACTTPEKQPQDPPPPEPLSRPALRLQPPRLVLATGSSYYSGGAPTQGSSSERAAIETAIETGPERSYEPPLEQRLKSVQVPGLTVRDEESLRAVVGQLRTMTGLPLIVDARAENAVLDEGVLFDFALQNPISVENLLELIVDAAGEDVTWVIRHDAVIITTREAARKGRMVLATYDVRSLTFGRTDFSGPRIDRIRLLDELEDDDGGGPFGGVGESIQNMDQDALVELLRENVEPEAWEEEGATLEVNEGLLIVVHTPAVQRRVQHFLSRLGAF